MKLTADLSHLQKHLTNVSSNSRYCFLEMWQQQKNDDSSIHEFGFEWRSFL